MSMKIRVERPKVIWRQVADQIRTKIISGNLPPGTKLPSTAEVAAQSGTDVKTVHRALTDLVREGLITRTRKVGTHVTDRQTELSRIGIYHPSRSELDPLSLFVQHLQAQLHQQAHQAHIITHSFIDQRLPARQDTAPAELEKAARERQIQGLITTVSDPLHAAWLRKLPLPVAYNSGNQPTSIRTDVMQMLDLSLDQIHRQGGRSAAVISPFRTNFAAFHQGFHEKARARGMTTREEWICHPDDSAPFDVGDYNAFGYQAFLRLWSQKTHPAGLIVYPDTMVTGVVMAILSRQVKIPRELKVVFHKNDTIDYFCPLPANYIVSSIPAAARLLLKQLRDAFRGRPTKPAYLDFTIAPSA